MELSEEAKRDHQRADRVIERLQATAEMFEFGCAMMRQNLVRRFPSDSSDVRDERFLRWLRKEAIEDEGRDRTG